MERPGLARGLALTALVASLIAGGAWLVARRGAGSAPGAVALPGQRIVVEVLNGSGQTGLARRVTRLLRERGVDVIYFGTAVRLADSTRVLVRRGEPARGHEVARALGAGVVRVEPDTLLRVDVTVVLGRDFRMPRGSPPI